MASMMERFLMVVKTKTGAVKQLGYFMIVLLAHIFVDPHIQYA